MEHLKAATADFAGALQHAVDEFLHLLLLEGLLDEVDRPLLEGFDRLRHVAVAGDEDEGRVDATLEEVILNVRTRHAGHAQVAQNHGRNVFVELRDERFAAFVIFDAVVVGFE